MDEIRIGLYGLGHRGLAWLRLVQSIKGYRITAVGDMFPALHEPALSELDKRDGVAVYSVYEDILDDDNVDAIALLVRCQEQGSMAAQALEAGKHVNCEVPAAYTMEDCWRIVTAQEKSGLVYLLAEQDRYGGFFIAWRDLVQQGRLGHVTYCEGQYVGYKEPWRYYRDWKTGQFVDLKDLAAHPDARPTQMQLEQPIHYIPHELSPILMVLDDRVVKVTAMSTNAPSYTHPEVNKADIQVALMHTEKDTILRLACSWLAPTPPSDHHYYSMMGTRGSVETARTSSDRARFWFADSQMHDMAEVDWRYERTDATPEELASGHYGMDYYVHTAFRDAVLGIKPLDFDVYKAVDTAAPAILAADSIQQGSAPMDVPDFRPSAARPAGKIPETI